MKIKSMFVSAVSLVFALTLAGCSGGSSSPAKAVPGVSKGVITAKGSVFVNGVEYVTTGAGVTTNKSSGNESDLLVGRVVTVKGSQSDEQHGSAESIEYNDNLEGPVDVAPDLVKNTFQALGQAVAVNTTALTVAAGKTVFNGFTSLSRLAVNSIVEVSGIPDANGVIQASYVELKGTLASTTSIELKGTISNLNTAAKTFMIGALTVDYGAFPASLKDLNGVITNGQFVEVKGTGAGYTAGASPKLVATKIESDKEDVNGTEGNKLSVEGFVTGFTAGVNTFKVNGQAVNTGTLSLTGIDMTKKVEVEGTLNNGVLMATKIKKSS